MVVSTASMNYRFNKNKQNGQPKQPKRIQNILGRIESGKLQTDINPQLTKPGQLKGFTGKGGKLAVDPSTGAVINKNQRIKPKDWLMQQRASGGAVEQATDFGFDLPGSGAQEAQQAVGGTVGNIAQASQGLLGAGGAQTQTGSLFAGQGAGALLGNISQAGTQSGLQAINQANALNQMQQLQGTALDPTISNPLFEANRQARIGEAQALESNLMDAFGRNRASDIAQLASRGILDSTTAENTLAARDAQLGLALNQLLSNANEASRQEVLGERSRIGDVASAFGQNQSLQAAQQGGLAADLLKTQASAAGTLGNLGLGQQGVGANLAGLGISGLGEAGKLGLGAGELGLANVNQLAQLQLGELGQRLLGQQTGLQNQEALKNARINRQMTKQQMDYLDELRAAQAAGGGFSLGGMGSGAAIGAGIGSIVPGVGTIAGGAIGAGIGGLFG